MAFDPLVAARDMAQAAEAIADTIRTGQGALATKADLDMLKAELRPEIRELRGNMDSRFAEPRHE
ncbi:MAG: hypothetical protein GDA36_02475 [Rhodobacteraceae bacterium]|nr:hypothetical protein [Paracoccaceae bacterium]